MDKIIEELISELIKTPVEELPSIKEEWLKSLSELKVREPIIKLCSQITDMVIEQKRNKA